MNKREKMLIAAVLCLVGLMLVKSMFGRYQRSLTQKREDVAAAKLELNTVDFELQKAKIADRDLARWHEQSLPYDPESPDTSRELAEMRYSQWLNKTLADAGLEGVSVTPIPANRLIHPDVNSISFQVNAKGSRANFVDFLYNFYKKAQLQQITWLDARADGNNLALQMRLEALMLTGATNQYDLPTETHHPFLLADVGAYRTNIESRNIFEPFQRPSPPNQRPQPDERGRDEPPPFDHSRFAKFSGTTLGSQGLLAWINVETTGEAMFRSVGDAINVGQYRGKVVAIEPRAIVLEADGKRSRVEIGSMLLDGKPVAAAPPDRSEGEGEPSAGGN
jgi:hypothetical protein